MLRVEFKVEGGAHGRVELDKMKVELLVKLSYKHVKGGAQGQVELGMLK
ncbi:hypothetical protein A2U01_0034810, partial [Trifolium medium]|nr:hypothetical protein [Trifolium medium]